MASHAFRRAGDSVGYSHQYFYFISILTDYKAEKVIKGALQYTVNSLEKRLDNILLSHLFSLVFWLGIGFLINRV